MNLFIRIFLASIALLGAAGAQSPASGNQATELTLLEIVEETGFLIWPLTALSVIAGATSQVRLRL